jgi:hypothetical protein
LDTAGHIAAMHGTKFAPVFARQSVRENEPTRQTPQQVIDNAKRTILHLHGIDKWIAGQFEQETLWRAIVKYE